jgi:hypothetical protein
LLPSFLLLTAACVQPAGPGNGGNGGSVPAGPEINLATAEDLAKIGVDDEYPLNGIYTLTADITLDNWSPIGTAVWGQAGNTNTNDPPPVYLTDSSKPFSGSFDGGGHTITLNSFSDDAGGYHYIGIFSALKGVETAGAVIKNLNIVSSVDVSLTNDKGSAMGLLAGYAEEAEISDIGLSGSLATTSQRNAYVGGLLGFSSTGTLVKASSSSMDIRHSAGTGGGLVDTSFYNFAGGFVGIFKGGADIVNCRGEGDLRVIGNKPGSQAFAGGIAGGSYYGFTSIGQGSISYCSTTGDVYCEVEGFWAWTGGIAGCICGDGDGTFEGATKIYRSRASGNISSVAKAGQWPYTGGIAGYVYYGAAVAECYFTGTVEAKANQPDSGINDYTGGIAGYLSKNEKHEGIIRDCWSEGTVKGYLNAGGIVGQQQAHTYLWNCWSKAAITVNAPANVAGSTSAQGAGGIAGFNGSQETGGAKRQGRALSGCVALNPSIAAPNGFERVGRVIGDNAGTRENNHGWSGMTFTVSHTTAVDGEDCAEKPPQSFYQGLGWDFETVWEMAGDYPALRWEQ